MPAGSNGRATPLGQRGDVPLHVRLRGIEQIAAGGGSGGGSARRLGPLPVGELLHPAALAALAALVANDWWAKRVCPGWLTGKLSDVAGLIAAPLALSAALGCAAWLAAALGASIGVSIDPSLRPRRLRLCLAAIAAPFIAAKTSAAAAGALTEVLALFGGRPRIICDPSDLLALPALYVAWWIGCAELRLVPRGRVHAVLRGARPVAGALADVRAAGADATRVAELEDALRARVRLDAARAGGATDDEAPAADQAIDRALRQLAC